MSMGALPGNGLFLSILLTATVFLWPSVLTAQDDPANDPLFFDESQLFSEENIVTPPVSAQSEATPLYTDLRSVGFSGRLATYAIYGADRDWLFGRGGRFDDNDLTILTEADFFIDIRLQKEVKAFIDVGLLNFADPDGLATDNVLTTLIDIKEFFVDMNIDRALYIRSGKQFLKWGRTFFWNPVDFVNTDQKDFLNLNQIRSGVYGVRLHAPMGVERNAYMFVKTADADNLDDFSWLGKYEFLTNGSEIGVSVLLKPRQASRFGVDLSSRIQEWNIAFETAVSYGSNTPRVGMTNGQIVTDVPAGQWILESALNLSRAWNWERPDRIQFSYEVFYNGDGYSYNILDDPDKAAYLFANGLYQPNYLSTWYHAAFVTISEFPTHSTTLTLNGIQNLVDFSAILSAGLDYIVTDGFTVGVQLSAFIGQNNSEYLLAGNAVEGRLTSTLLF